MFYYAVKVGRKPGIYISRKKYEKIYKKDLAMLFVKI